MYRGSRKHVLDWTESDQFPIELLELAAPAKAMLTAASSWLPRGYQLPDEAELHWFGPSALSGLLVWPSLHSWWLKHKRNATTPNWDIAMVCEIDGKPGLILVEAKAHETELERKGKRCEATNSAHSRENHEQIKKAIDEARLGYAALGYKLSIGISKHYQLSNRLSYAWKLAQLGVPTVLIYLGFLGDYAWEAGVVPFKDESHWNSSIHAYFKEIRAAQLLGRELSVGGTPAWFLVRTRRIKERSMQGGFPS